jgi:hypothetical protein
MSRRATLAFVVVAALCALIVDLHGYVLEGPNWGTQQVSYYINPQNAYVSTSAAVAAIQSAGANWTTQTGANVQLVNVGTTSASTLALDYQNNVFFRNDSNGAYAAETYWWSGGNGKMIDADIVIHEANYVYFTGASGCTNNGLYVEDILTHEFGHALGLAHSSVATATMYPSVSYCSMDLRSLDPDDISGILTLYPAGSSSSTLPAAPSGLVAAPNVSNPSSSTSLAWVDNATNATGYVVQRSSDGATFAQIAQLGSSATSYSDSGLAAGTMYYYRVFAYSSAGSSPYSNVASAQTQVTAQVVTQAPSAFSNVSPTNGATNVNGNITLSWGVAPGAQAYDVYFGTSTSPSLRASNVSSTSTNVGSLNSGTTYFWMVVAKNGAGTTAGPLWSFTMKTTGKPKK